VNRPAFLRLAVIGACMAFVLAGCGRKGALDPPPAAGTPAAQEQTQDQNPAGRSPFGARPLSGTDSSSSDAPAESPPPQRRLPIDWLLN